MDKLFPIRRFSVACWILILIQCISTVMHAQPKKGKQDADAVGENRNVPTIDKFFPKPMLKVAKTDLTRAKFAVIDIHGHFGVRLKGDKTALDKYVDVMDQNNIAISTTLDAVLGGEEKHLSFLKNHDSRFLAFCHIDFVGNGNLENPNTHACNHPNFVREVCLKLEAAKRKGIVGLKFFKQFGLGYRNTDGSLIKINDKRFDAIWEKCGQLGLPVLIHTADPAAFFQPINDRNERYEELLRHPNWSFHGDEFPSREELLAARNDVIKRHPGTNFIGAHLANNPEDLSVVGNWLNEYPNLYVEISSRIGELGRQPFTARKFVLRYQDRVLFGTDGPWPEQRLKYYWRFLETRDEYFPYSEKFPQPQGLWFIYGIGLPDDVLKKIYFENAMRLIPSARKKYMRDSPIDH